MPKVKKDKKASTTSSSSTGPILLKDLQWDNRKKLWRTSDRRRQWSSFKDKQLNNGGTYRLKGDLSVEIPLPDLFSDDLYDPGTSNITSLLLHRIQSCDLETLHLENQNITFNEYLKLTASKNISMLFFDFVKITDEDGTVVSVDRIMAQLPKIRRIEIKGGYRGESIFTADAAKKLVQLPRFEKLWILELHEITPDFNVDDFCDFILKHKSQKVQYYFELDDPIDAASDDDDSEDGKKEESGAAAVLDDIGNANDSKNKNKEESSALHAAEAYTKKFHAAMNKIIEEWNETPKITIMINGGEYPFEC